MSSEVTVLPVENLKVLLFSPSPIELVAYACTEYVVLGSRSLMSAVATPPALNLPSLALWVVVPLGPVTTKVTEVIVM